MQTLLIACRAPYAGLMRHPALLDDDAELARRIAAAEPGRDASAEAELCRRFAPRVRLYGLRHLRSYLHDGRADTVEDAVLAHRGDGSEASASVDAFDALAPEDRDVLLTFVESL